MNLVISRYRKSANYTVSRLYDADARRLFLMDVIEPPLSAMAHPGATMMSLNPGFYRLFLKGDKVNCELVTVFRKVARRPRFGFVHTTQKLPLNEVHFNYKNHFVAAPLWIGKFDDKNLCLQPDSEAYNRFMIRLIIAKQNAEIINVKVK